MLSKSKVYFTKSTTPEKIVDLYKIINKPLPGKIAVKVHSGARGNPNFIHSDFFKPIMDHIKGTIVECNSSTRERSTTEGHMKIMEEHGWISLYGKNVEILDSEKPDLEVEIPEGKIIKKNFIGKGITKYDSVIVMTHFKAHGARTVGGIAGAFKQLSIGFASSAGKIWQHT
ncbi:MAG: DUF362 domain-containing protein, partial [archaeon]|nr:DUF362 domain-containing protein [archaeon]